ncbi:MAG: bifunctional methylenetetrahydrofolate dehydrogenase/methenyltetrahydrofolate cyclohydrolase FolD [Deltaproteobacteria bacterium]|nr:bifunctional methylenetetrahydrofolate dehydrogenase/methenyltetrahydrofolate cyclohydrolase FolD [Deltaproteobacteria bacterium]
MPAQLIDGKALSAQVRAQVQADVQALQKAHGLTPGLAVVRVGDDPASVIYVRNKIKACHETGVLSFDNILPEATTQAELLALIDKLNADPRVHGILVQLPVPKHIDADAVIDRLAAQKDVDGFGPRNTYLLSAGRPGLRPCTPYGCIKLLESVDTKFAGAQALVVGRSNIVGKPMAMLLLERNCTVTIAHSRTPDLAAEVARADIVVAAVGKTEIVKGAWVKPGSVLIDVGINRQVGGKLKGDIEFAPAAEHARAITPVPGGVGPMTIAMLLANTVEAAKKSISG